MKIKENNINININININNPSFNNSNVAINSNNNKQSIINKSKKIKYKKIINEINNSEASLELKNELILIIKEIKKEKEANKNIDNLYIRLTNIIGSHSSIFSFMLPYLTLFEGVTK